MTNAVPQRVVREIPATKPDAVDRLRSAAEQLRVVAYPGGGDITHWQRQYAHHEN